MVHTPSCCDLQSRSDLQEAALERDALRLDAVHVEACYDEPTIERSSRDIQVAVDMDAQTVGDHLHAELPDDASRPRVVAGRDEDGRSLARQLVHRALNDDPSLVDDRDRVA